MRWARLGGLAVVAALFIGAGTPPASGEPEPRARQRPPIPTDTAKPIPQVDLLSPDGAGSAAGSSRSATSDVSAAAITDGLCFRNIYSDADEPGDVLLDATTYEFGFDCVSSRWVLGITTLDTWAPSDLGFMDLWIDVDGSLTNGCDGAEFVAVVFTDELGELFGDVLRTSTGCGTFTPVANHGLGFDQLDNMAALSFNSAPFRSFATLRWQASITHWTIEDPIDFLPDGLLSNGNFRSAPGDPCKRRCFYLTNGTTGGSAEIVFRDTQPASQILIGDWNNDGVDSFGFRTQNSYVLKNAHAPTPPDISFAYGRATDVTFTGDWNGDGVDTLATRRGNTYFLKNSFGGGAADITVSYGRATDVVLVGDWNGDGRDTLAVRRGNTYFLKNSFTGGTADVTFAFGRATDITFVGDWNNDGRDSLGVRR
jgi:hypothetical protein